MTDRQRAKDVKDFSELVKAELAKQGNYVNQSLGGSMLAVNASILDLQAQVKATCYHSNLYYPDAIQSAVALATQALVLACNAQRALDEWEALRA